MCRVSRKSDTRRVSYRLPSRVVTALVNRARETRRSQTTVLLMALEKDGIPAVK